MYSTLVWLVSPLSHFQLEFPCILVKVGRLSFPSFLSEALVSIISLEQQSQWLSELLLCRNRPDGLDIPASPNNDCLRVHLDFECSRLENSFAALLLLSAESNSNPLFCLRPIGEQNFIVFNSVFLPYLPFWKLEFISGIFYCKGQDHILRLPTELSQYVLD